MNMYTRCPYCSERINLKMSYEDGKPDLSPVSDHIEEHYPEKSIWTTNKKGYRIGTMPYCPILFDEDEEQEVDLFQATVDAISSVYGSQ